MSWSSTKYTLHGVMVTETNRAALWDLDSRSLESRQGEIKEQVYREKQTHHDSKVVNVKKERTVWDPHSLPVSIEGYP